MGRNKPHPGGKKAPVGKNKNKKLVITFDAEKRKEYLTGFHKRKQERRRFGLDMEAFKQKKQLMEARKQRREEQKARLAQLNIPDDDEDETKVQKAEDEDDDSDEENADATQVLTFDDAHTQSKFGDVVTVTTSVGGIESDSASEEDEVSDVDEIDAELAAQARAKKGDRSHGKQPQQQLSLFQRIQLKRKGMALPTRRSKLKHVRESRKAMLGGGKKAGKKGNVGRVKGLQQKKDDARADKSDSKGKSKRRKH